MVPHVLCTAVEYDIRCVGGVEQFLLGGDPRTCSTPTSMAASTGTAFYQGPERKPYNPELAAWARAAA